jgi:hypothetical protein
MIPSQKRRGKRDRPEAYRPAPKPTVPRLARSYQAVTKFPFDSTTYPAQVNSAAPSLHDLGLCQGLFANQRNFSPQTKCDLFELYEDGAGRWQYGLDDAKLVDYVQGTKMRQSKSPAPTEIPSVPFDVPVSKNVKMRAM